VTHEDHKAMILKDHEVGSCKPRTFFDLLPYADSDKAKVNGDDNGVGKSGTHDATFFKNKPH